MPEPGYGSFEAYPCRFTDAEAWVAIDDEWKEFNAVEVAMNASVMTKDAYEATFPDVPPMPKAAFQSGG